MPASRTGLLKALVEGLVQDDIARNPARVHANVPVRNRSAEARRHSDSVRVLAKTTTLEALREGVAEAEDPERGVSGHGGERQRSRIRCLIRLRALMLCSSWSEMDKSKKGKHCCYRTRRMNGWGCTGRDGGKWMQGAGDAPKRDAGDRRQVRPSWLALCTAHAA